MPGLCDVTPEDEVTGNPLGKLFGSAAHRSDLICLQTHANFLQPHHRCNFVLQPFHNLPWRSCRSAPQHPAHRALHRAGADPLQELLARLTGSPQEAPQCDAPGEAFSDVARTYGVNPAAMANGGVLIFSFSPKLQNGIAYNEDIL
jgi:hypothetical protein